VTNSARVRVERVDFADAPGSSKPGLMFRWCQDVAAVACRFHDCGTALRIIDSQGVSVERGKFCDLRGDGVQSTGSSRVTISRNVFTDFYPRPGDHPDAIQFFTLNQKTPATDITVTDNIVTRGRGGIIQGVFMGNEAKIPYEGVLIAGNALEGTMYNGIAVSCGRRVTVRDNAITPGEDMNSWISLGAVDGLTLGENRAQVTVKESLNVAQEASARADLMAQVADLTAKLDAVRAALA